MPCLGSSGFSKKSARVKKATEYIDIIDDSSHSLLQLIEDILDFSKIESGNLTVEKIFFDPSKELKNQIDLFRAKSEEKNLKLITNTDENFPASIKNRPSEA